MKFSFFFALIFSFSLAPAVFAESSHQGTGAAGTAGAVATGPSNQDPGTVGNGVGGMGTGTAGDHANGTRSDTNTKPGHSLKKGNPGNPSSRYKAHENGTPDKP